MSSVLRHIGADANRVTSPEPIREASALPPKVLSQQRQLLERLDRGGLAQVSSRGGSKTYFALSCVSASLHSRPGAPPFLLWIADEGFPYPPLLARYWDLPLGRFLMVQPPSPAETWKAALEAVQTGIFGWVLVRPSRGGPPLAARRLQLAAEKTACRVLLLLDAPFPHWTLKASFVVDGECCYAPKPDPVLPELTR